MDGRRELSPLSPPVVTGGASAVSPEIGNHVSFSARKLSSVMFMVQDVDPCAGIMGSVCGDTLRELCLDSGTEQPDI